eukprot:1116546-Prymnesium_polylepis.1
MPPSALSPSKPRAQALSVFRRSRVSSRGGHPTRQLKPASRWPRADFADDIEIPPGAESWSHEQAHEFFDSGGLVVPEA